MKAKMTADISGAKKKTAKLRKMPEATGRTLEHFAGQVIKRVKRDVAGGRVVGKYKWGKKTGALERSVSHRLERRGEIFELIIGTGVTHPTAASKYAGILDRGGIIRPKTKPYLAVPMPDGSIRLKKQVIIPEFKWFRISIRDELHLLKGIKLKNDILKEMGFK